jgi:GNAT superfamily N-acetyltransferase
MDIDVRQAVLADMQDLAVLLDAYRQFHGQPADIAGARTFLMDRFDHGESVIFIAHTASRAIGLTQLFPSFSSWALKRTYILNDMFVIEGFRRSGVGRLLLSHAAAYARSMGAVRMTLTTSSPIRARRHYMRMPAGGRILILSFTTSTRG